jgi:hypothetical protein
MITPYLHSAMCGALRKGFWDQDAPNFLHSTCLHHDDYTQVLDYTRGKGRLRYGTSVALYNNRLALIMALILENNLRS